MSQSTDRPGLPDRTGAVAAQAAPGDRASYPSLRLGIHNEATFRAGSGGGDLEVTVADYPFLLFACEVGGAFESLTFFGRSAPADTTGEFAHLPGRPNLVKLPHYDDLRQLGRLLRSTRGTLRAFAAGLDRVDIVWIVGPHPFSLPFALQALRRRKRVVLGVRQDTLRYYRSRMPSRRWYPTLAIVALLDGAFRLLARRVPTVAVGDGIARRYGGGAAPVLSTAISLVREAELAAEPAAARWEARIELLTVGRLEPEKNPLLLVEVLTELERQRPGTFRLTWAGSGWMADEIGARVRAADLDHAVHMAGFVPFGPALLSLYRRAHAFVHVSLTEGVPQVLVEALAAGLPIAATNVGGVPELLEGGRAGLLVPPGDRDAMVAAILRLTDDRELRNRVAERGLELARSTTLETLAGRVAAFIANGTREPARH